MNKRAFQADQVSKSFGALRVLDNVSITINPGEVVGLLGPNGAGKSTFINILAGYEKQDGGTVTIDGHPLDGLSPSARAKFGVARTFQSGRLFGKLTVAENVALGAIGLGNSSKVAKERAESILEILGIEKLSPYPAESISHGNARLVGLARAVAAHPEYLIMDEPAAGLNEDEAPRLIHALESVTKNIGCGMLLVEHNVKLVTEACSRVIVLATGTLIFDGDPHEALKHEEVKSAYLGNAGAH
ncbi:MAG: ABC transporter ATP-binding protein [Actinomycetes bacterium]